MIKVMFKILCNITLTENTAANKIYGKDRIPAFFANIRLYDTYYCLNI